MIPSFMLQKGLIDEDNGVSWGRRQVVWAVWNRPHQEHRLIPSRSVKIGISECQSQKSISAKTNLSVEHKKASSGL